LTVWDYVLVFLTIDGYVLPSRIIIIGRFIERFFFVSVSF
jgi:hypothetical protein